ncbi:MAG: lysophospholipid acyltransferase family protein [Saprospiraceae bacterium]
MLTILRGVFRLALFIAVLAFYVTRLVIINFFKGGDLDRGLRHRKQCCVTMMKVIGVETTFKGNIHEEDSYLYISNHRCYLDPVAELIKITALPVAKAEVADLPIMGYGASITGVHFVKRESLKSRKETRSSIAETIEGGKSILIYPEGTTIDTPTTASFKPGTFHMAAKDKVKIIPIAIEYGHVGDPWVGKDNMPIHFFKQFGMRNKKITVHYGDPIWMEDGEALKVAVRSWIDNALLDIRKDWGLPV